MSNRCCFQAYFELAAHGIQMTLTIATAGATAGQLIYIRNKDERATLESVIPAETTVQYIFDGSAWNPVKEATSRRRLLASDAEDTGFTPVSNPLFSDKRLKKDIQTIQNASEKLQNIRGVTYYFDENIHTKDIKHLPEKEQIGVIAQEVEKVLPQVVTENDNGIKKVDYSSLTGFLIQVNKEQEVKLEKQQAQLDQLTMLLKEERQDRKLSEQNNRFERNIMFAFISLTICFMFLFQKRN